jgi:hypothetical protein
MDRVPTTATAPSTNPFAHLTLAPAVVDWVQVPVASPAAAFQALVTEYGLQVEEWDTVTLDPKLRDKFMAFYLETDGKRILVVPVGQDPAERLHALRSLLAHQEVTPV